MNAIAARLNDQIEGTVGLRALSDLGRRMYFPKGIVAQSAEAKERATRFNATVGMAYSGGTVMTLPLIRDLTGGMDPAQSVAYAPTAGVGALRSRWKREMERKNPDLVGIPTTLPAVVPGLTAGIALVADLFADDGGEVLVPDLFWGNYRLIFEERRRATVREFQFFTADGAFDRSAFADGARAAARSGKLMVVLNFPNNPAGYTPTVEDAEAIVETLRSLAESVPVVVVCDDAYWGLFYGDGLFRQSLFTRLAAAHTNLMAIKVDGATKEDFVWGFRVGFVTMAFSGMTPDHAAALEQKLMGAIRAAVSNSSMLSQSLLLAAMDHPEYASQKAAAFAELSGRYEELQMILAEKERTGRAPALRPLPCNSGYFMSFRCDGLSAEALRLALLDEGVGVISVKDLYLRVAFAGVDRGQLRDLYNAIFDAAERLATS